MLCLVGLRFTSAVLDMIYLAFTWGIFPSFSLIFFAVSLSRLPEPQIFRYSPHLSSSLLYAFVNPLNMYEASGISQNPLHNALQWSLEWLIPSMVTSCVLCLFQSPWRTSTRLISPSSLTATSMHVVSTWPTMCTTSPCQTSQVLAKVDFLVCWWSLIQSSRRPPGVQWLRVHLCSAQKPWFSCQFCKLIPKKRLKIFE